MLVKVRKYLTDSEYCQNPLPFRTMKVKEVKRETEKAVLVSLYASPVPQSECICCGKIIKEKRSLYFGIGSTCLKKHYPHLLSCVNYDEIEKSYELLKEEMQKIVWSGWLPKSAIEMIPEKTVTDIIFTYEGNTYHIQTEKADKILEIEEKAESIISIKEVNL